MNLGSLWRDYNLGQTSSMCIIDIQVNGSQLAKMKKSIPDMSLPWNL